MKKENSGIAKPKLHISMEQEIYVMQLSCSSCESEISKSALFPD